MSKLAATGHLAAPAPMPPSVAGWPVVGVAPRAMSDPLGYLEAVCAAEGDIVRLRVGNRWVLLVRDAAAVDHVLRHPLDFDKGSPNFRRFATILGDSIVTASHGAFWRAQRRAATGALAPQRDAHLERGIDRALADLFQSWDDAAAAGRVVDAERAMLATTLVAVGHHLFGQDLAPIASRWSRAAVAAQKSLAPASARSVLSWALGLPVPPGPRLNEAVRTMRAVAEEVIDAAPPGATLVTHLRAERAAGRMTEVQLRDAVVTYLQAGHETTACALTWLLHLAALHPELQARVAAEAAAAGNATRTDQPLPFTTMLTLEALRLYPPAWAIERRAIRDGAVGGFAVEAGITIVLSPYLVHRNPAYWDTPHACRPERFEDGARRRSQAFVPFGAGPRGCSGQRVALVEIPVIAAAILGRYELRSATRRDPVPEPLFNLRPRGGLPLRVRRRAGPEA